MKYDFGPNDSRSSRPFQTLGKFPPFAIEPCRPFLAALSFLVSLPSESLVFPLHPHHRLSQLDEPGRRPIANLFGSFHPVGPETYFFFRSVNPPPPGGGVEVGGSCRPPPGAFGSWAERGDGLRFTDGGKWFKNRGGGRHSGSEA